MAVHQNTQSQQLALQRYINGAYTGQSGFHQDNAAQQAARQTRTNGAYDSTTPKSILANPSSNYSSDGSGLKGNISSASQSTQLIGNGGGSGYGYSEGGYASGGGGTDYASMIAELIAQQRAAAENAYGNSMKRLGEAYDNSLKRLENAWDANGTTLQKNLDSTLNRLQNNLNYTQGQVNDDSAKSLREAYVNYMLNKKNLAQGLSAMGISGGATESSMANMFNNYGNARNNINTTAAENLARLLNEYQGNVASANQLYNSQYADALNQRAQQLNNLEQTKNAQQNTLEQALASELTNLYTGGNLSQYANYASTLNSLAQPTFSTASFSNGSYARDLTDIGKNAGQNLTPIENTLALNSVTTNSANNMGTVTDYAKYKAMADSIAAEGGNTANIIYQLKNSGADNNMIYKVLGV